MRWANELEHNPALPIFPELQISHIQEQIALIEERADNIIDALESHVEAQRNVEEDFPPSKAPLPGQQGIGSDARPDSCLEGTPKPLAAPSGQPSCRHVGGNNAQNQEAPSSLRTTRNTRTEPQVSRESSIAESRRQLWKVNS